MRRRLFHPLCLPLILSLVVSYHTLLSPAYAEEAAPWNNLRENEGAHFIIQYRGGENAVAGHVIGILLEEAYISVGGDFDYYLDEKVNAYLYTKERFRDITKSPSWAGAIYDGAIRLPTGGITEKTELLEEVLFHEYTHAVVHHLSGGRAPMWLNEGIAQYEEGKRQEDYRAILGNILAGGHNNITLRKLEGSFLGMNTADATVAYLLSLSATEYLVNEFGIMAVRRILEALGEGSDLDDAIFSALYLPYDELERHWLLSLKRTFND